VLPFLFPWLTLPLARRGAIVKRRRAKTFFWGKREKRVLWHSRPLWLHNRFWPVGSKMQKLGA
jgi:hypothetical protein